MEELRTGENEIQIAGSHTEQPIQSPNPEPTIVTWNGLLGPQDPFNWSLRKKWLVITLAFLASFISSMNGTIISVAHNPINKEFGISDSHFPNSY
ncbi:hypothetical protein OCU04_003080 [Sclerotinia nivalis]|uniref:Major facilitator superfamily (MFS) profile domain-containing protein n=1 Tax=Sclerotinia nivalis TaxID=352851 RepID=A0A9X0AUY4_9HELO|nr:hypothetical protein OCU04_003080 [Sclerotinia nivalis]